jgi:putative hemolysin
VIFSEDFPLLKIVILLMCSAFFSATETSLFSLSRFQLRQLKERNSAIFKKIQYLLDRPAALVITVLIGNEFINILISHLMANFYDKSVKSAVYAAVINVGTVVPLILIFGEITPKILAAKTNLKTSVFVTPLLWIFYRITLPIRWVLESIVNLLTIGFRKSGEERNINEEDFLSLVEEGKSKGVIHASEQELIENIFEIDDDNVLELSTPLSEMVTVNDNTDILEVFKDLKKRFAPRIPVWSQHPSQVVGILYVKDLLNLIQREPTGVKVKHIMKSPLFVEPSMRAEALFKRFRQLKVHIAIIEDKSGRSLAAITMEDILEQMFGELWEEDIKK